MVRSAVLLGLLLAHWLGVAGDEEVKSGETLAEECAVDDAGCIPPSSEPHSSDSVSSSSSSQKKQHTPPEAMSRSVQQTFALGRGPWKTFDPFLFCVYHKDEYPAGTKSLGPEPKQLRGRDIGSDFSYKDGWSMYHGDVVPGFPEHPHRGFETITVTRQGYVDHFDSLGAKGRYGVGDTQWMTAGEGVQHCEMFPLLNQDGPNLMELFQIWLNLPAKSKFVKADYKMLWAPDTPTITMPDGKSTIRVVAGNPEYFAKTHPELKVPQPPAASWASQPGSDVAVWEIKMPADATVTLPPAMLSGVNRAFYFFDGKKVVIGDSTLTPMNGAKVDSTQEVTITVKDAPAQLLMLQGKPIGEPVVQHGPFVMNTQQEIMQAFSDFQRTRFGGWPFDRSDPTNGDSTNRFAQYSDGRLEKPSA